MKWLFSNLVYSEITNVVQGYVCAGMERKVVFIAAWIGFVGVIWGLGCYGVERWTKFPWLSSKICVRGKIIIRGQIATRTLYVVLEWTVGRVVEWLGWVLQVRNGVGLTFPFRVGQGANCVPHDLLSLTGLNYELEDQTSIQDPNWGSYSKSGIQVWIWSPTSESGFKFKDSSMDIF